MEIYEELRDKAVKNLKIADHMLTQTYPLVNDPRILITVVENIFLSLTNAMGALLHYERLNKNVPLFEDNFESKFNLFKLKMVDKHKISKEYVKMINDIKNIIIAHKRSPVEFSRKDVFVICSDKYEMQKITIDNIKNYISKSKSFIDQINFIISQKKHDGYL
ncbi:MAG: hypothetical protein N3D84_00685 [Candidatus Woesearchaeota archaeon]|nr:hypothetical protein [Candidatus Woesearchaeota archaeon]